MDINDLMSNLGPIQDAMKQGDDERAQALFEGSAGGGAVTVRLKGDLSFDRIKIAPAAISADEDDIGMLEDLIVIAINDALKKYKVKFGATPEEQLQRSLSNSDIGSLLGPLLGGMKP
jgi:DNA-binding YbaB/EbfC family protein